MVVAVEKASDMEYAAPATLVRPVIVLPGLLPPVTATRTEKVPLLAPAVRYFVTLPLASVMPVAPSAKLPVAPVVGSVNVTVLPETGLLYRSRTVATSGVAKEVPTVARWLLPDTLTEAGTSAVFVRWNAPVGFVPPATATPMVTLPAMVLVVKPTLTLPSALVMPSTSPTQLQSSD